MKQESANQMVYRAYLGEEKKKGLSASMVKGEWGALSNQQKEKYIQIRKEKLDDPRFRYKITKKSECLQTARKSMALLEAMSLPHTLQKQYWVPHVLHYRQGLVIKAMSRQ
eukprot:g15219.t1